MKYASTVELYIESKPEWTEALLLMREILSETDLEETRQNRLEKILPLIRLGIGLYDKYSK